MNKICYKCHGNMIEREIEITSGWGEYELAIKGVRAFVCEECGAISLRAEEAKMMEDISRGFAERPEDERPDYLNVEETADLLRVSTQTVYNMIKSGRLKGTKFGREWRFLRKNLESLIQPDQAITVRNTSAQNYEKDSAILDAIRKKRNVHE
ncbi:MAG: helix-turn-helix domain-containing protein [Agathobacter rectalis]|uniref:Helix-turn-helix domain protein n=1 Tax=virus sp. ctReX5 TaxID=2825818 RepID=A0A8S5RLJ8_9VIRU|nr:MAG TPA: helix-turn-helix domain protein [virus sp. ctReX5]DAK73184.1 MAG TPA: helix-turn-helix domain protein [Bacteriophage sp.]